VPPVNGTRQNEATIASANAYYGYALNPFENYLLTAKANIQLNERMRLDFEPYFWYGYGTGGVQQTSLNEATGGTAPTAGGRIGRGLADMNGDGDTLDTVLVYRGSVTKTNRPGVTTKLSYSLDNHKILGGIWLERARHRQTQPATTVDNAGNIADLWLKNETVLVRRADGTLYQGRDWLTVSTGKSVFIQDTMDLMNSKLQVIPSVSYRQIDRDFTNYANDTTNGGVDYNVQRKYSKLLPSLNASYMVNDRVQGFVGVAQNMRAPSNFELGNSVTSVTYVNGVPTASAVAFRNTVKEETSTNLDLGARYRGDMFKASVTAFLVQFKNRIARGFDPIQAGTFDINVGDSTTKGLEIEGGTVPINGFSAYVSGTYTRSTIKSDLQTGATTFAPTAGKIFPDTPKGMASASLQYANGPYLVNVAGKYTSGRWLTLVNDQSIGSFTTVDLNAAWKLPNLAGEMFKNPVIRLNVSNLFDKRYLQANSGSGSNIAITSANNPSVYPGQPRFTSVTFQVDM
jgi:iron complex outermembrane receptor protein